MLTAVTSALETVIEWIGTVVEALITDGGALVELLPLLAIGVAISCLFVGIKAIRSFIWGA